MSYSKPTIEGLLHGKAVSSEEDKADDVERLLQGMTCDTCVHRDGYGQRACTRRLIKAASNTCASWLKPRWAWKP